MIKNKIVFLLMIIGFWSACTPKTDGYIFDPEKTVAIDESETVLNRYPSALREINDSVIAVINSAQKLSLYDPASGRNTGNFSTGKIDFDSLIKQTFQKKYEGKRRYTFDRQSAGGLSGNNCQISSFYYYDGHFYIYVNTLCGIDYYNDSAALAKYSETEQVKQLKKNKVQVNLQIVEFLDFILVTDDHLNLSDIIPLYERPLLKKDNYSPAYFKGFAIKGNEITVPLRRDDQSAEKITSPLHCNPGFYALAKLDLKNEAAADYKLDYKTIDFSKFSMHDFYEVSFSFFNTGTSLLFSNGKDICETESGKKIFAGSNLQPDEWIENFYVKDNSIMIMATYRLDKKQHPTEFEKSYGIDSLNTIKVRTFNTAASNWTDEKAITANNRPLIITKNKIIYMDKNKEHYYFKSIAYHEK